MTKAADLMPRENAFETRMYQIYGAMKQRFKEKRNKRGRIIRIGRELPFDCLDFKAWVEKLLAGKAGAVQCFYCKKWMTALDIGFDHVNPIAQGGGLGLDNLAACCSDCQRLKGKLSLRTFRWLLDAMQFAGLGEEQMTVVDRTDLSLRLKTGGIQYRDFKKKPKKEAPAETTAEIF